jgi:hypothetical protein
VKPSDQLVTARHVLRATQEIHRRRARAVLSELEALEPDLAEYAIENLSQLHHDLVGGGLSGRDARRAYRLAEATLLVSLMALRQGYRDQLGRGGGNDDDDAADGEPPVPADDARPSPPPP